MATRWTPKAVRNGLEQRGWSLASIGRVCGVRGSTVARWIDRSAPPAKAAAVIARRLGTTRAEVWPQRFPKVKALGEPSGPPYEATSTGRRLGSWGLSNAGPNAEIVHSLSTLRNRSREAFRNNPWARRATYSYGSNAIGTGITPRWRKEVSDLKPALRTLWRRWCKKADADGRSNFNGLQALIAVTQFLSGEVLVRFRPRRLEDGLPVPLQLQVLEPDHLDQSRDGALPNGNVIRAGIEFDQLGRRRAYYLYQSHPGENLPMSGNQFSAQTLRVPAEQVLHIYAVERPGQIRGVPRLASVLLSMYDLDRYDDAELVRKKAAAVLGGFIVQTLAPDQTMPFGVPQGLDQLQQQVAYLEPGSYPFLPPGWDVRNSQPADTGPNTEGWVRSQLRRMAAGALVTYEQLTGDLTGVNYSSIRAGLIEIRRMLEALIYNVFVFQFCEPVMERWIDAAFAAGKLPIVNFAERRDDLIDIDWRPQRWAWVDPVKDVMGTILEMRAGLNPRQDALAELGEDAEDIDDRYEEDNRRADEKKLVFDSDPRKTTSSGIAQAADSAASDVFKRAASGE